MEENVAEGHNDAEDRESKNVSRFCTMDVLNIKSTEIYSCMCMLYLYLYFDLIGANTSLIEPKLATVY